MTERDVNAVASHPKIRKLHAHLRHGDITTGEFLEQAAVYVPPSMQTAHLLEVLPGH